MSREQAAACPLAAGQLGLLALHRHVPEQGLAALIQRSQEIGHPIRLGMFHVEGCATCQSELLVGAHRLCLRGRRLLDACRAWRPRLEAP
jgi:hypothetical protein